MLSCLSNAGLIEVMMFFQGLALSRNIEAVDYLECSALRTEGLKHLFEQTILCALEHKSGYGKSKDPKVNSSNEMPPTQRNS